MKIVIDNGYGFSISKKAAKFMALLGCKIAKSELEANRKDWYGYGYDRTNPYLIQAVEILGEKANGNDAKLRIVEIPDDVKYHIVKDEMGGESIHEDHRVWY